MFNKQSFDSKKDIYELTRKISAVEELLKKESEKTELLTQLNKNHEILLEQLRENNIELSIALIEEITKKQKQASKKLKSIEQNLALIQKKTNSDQIHQPEKEDKLKLELSPTHKLLIGKIEKVKLTPPEKIFHARIDTGATTSSLDAKNIETFERNGSTWVKFKIKDPNKEIFYDVEKPLVRKVKILQASTDEASRRPVIELQFQIGGVKRIEEFTLEDRSHLEYQLLIGRNVLRDLMVVDVSQEFIVPLPDEKESEDQ